MRNLPLVIGVLWIGLHTELAVSADRGVGAGSGAQINISAVSDIDLRSAFILDASDGLDVAGSLDVADSAHGIDSPPAIDSAQLDGDLPVALHGHLSRWIDRRDNGDPLQVLRGERAAQFAPSLARNIEYDNRANWFRFEIDNRRSSDRQIMLVLDNILFFSIDVYFKDSVQNNSLVQSDRQQWQHRQAGLLLPWYGRAQDYRYYAFPLQLNAGAVTTVYMQVKAVGDTFFVPYLISERGLVRIASSTSARASLMTGIVIGIAAYMLLLIVAARDWSSATWYCLAAMFVGILILAFMNGELGPLLAHSPEWHANAGQVTINLEILLLLQLTRHAFQTWQHDVWIDRILRLLCYIEIGLLLPSPWLHPILAMPIVVMAIICVNYLTLLSIYFARQRRPSANYYLFGMIAFVIFNALFVLGRKGLLAPLAPVVHGYELSFCFQSAAFAMMLTDKLRRIRRERSLAEAKANIAEAESRAKSDFLAVMSHEIRTPLNGVLGMAELLAATPLDKPQRYYIKTIYNSGKALLRVLSDILDYSKVEAGKMELERVPFNVSEWLTTSIAPYRFNDAAQHLTFSATVSPDMPQWLLGDIVRLQQVLTNLLDNAFKFTARGEVALRIEPSRHAPGRVELCCSVRDTGPGIAADLQARLFRSIAQADASSTRKFSGTGLGLAICQRLVSLMGGTIELDSELGVGSTFRFRVWLPIAAVPTQTANAVDYPSADTAARS